MVSDLAKAEAESLQAAGIQLTLAEAVQLNEAGLKVEGQENRANPAKAGRPVRAGNVWLWPMTLAANEWFFEIGLPHYATERGKMMAMAFALAHGRKPKTFRGLVGKARIWRTVNRWMLGVGATFEELEDAIYRVSPELSYPHHLRCGASQSDPTGKGSSGIINQLVAATGRTADYWRGQDISYAGGILMTIYTQLAISSGCAAMEEDRHDRVTAEGEFDLLVRAIKKARE